MESLHNAVVLVIGLLAAALVVGILAERIRIPLTVALFIVSVPLHYSVAQDAFAPSLIFVFLPALIFEAAWNLDARSLRRTWRPIAFLAIVGVGVTAFVIGFGLAVAGQLPFDAALLLGAILAATDPVAVIPLFRNANVPEDLATIVEGESLFNDGVAVVLYGLVLDSMVSHTPFAFFPTAGAALYVSLGGALIGVAAAYLVMRLMRGVTDTALYIVASVVVAYSAYLGADALHISGIVAAVVAGIALRSFGRGRVSDSTSIEIDRFWAVASFFANAIVFLLMGLRIDLMRVVHEPMLVLLTLALMTLARALISITILPSVVGKLPHRWRRVIAVSGLRGALSLALAVALPADLPMRAQIIDAVFGVVLFTLIGQGLAIGPYLRHLGFRPSVS